MLALAQTTEQRTFPRASLGLAKRTADASQCFVSTLSRPEKPDIEGSGELRHRPVSARHPRTAAFRDTDAESLMRADLEGPAWQRAHWDVVCAAPLQEVVVIPRAGLGALRWYWFSLSVVTLSGCHDKCAMLFKRWRQSGAPTPSDRALDGMIACALPGLIGKLVCDGKIHSVEMSIGRRSAKRLWQLAPLGTLKASIVVPAPGSAKCRLSSGVFSLLAETLDA